MNPVETFQRTDKLPWPDPTTLMTGQACQHFESGDTAAGGIQFRLEERFEITLPQRRQKGRVWQRLRLCPGRIKDHSVRRLYSSQTADDTAFFARRTV